MLCGHLSGPYFDVLQVDQVSEVDIAGTVLRSYGGLLHGAGHILQELNWPKHLAVDSEGNVLVADRWNHRVLMLNSDLRLKRLLVGKEQVAEPEKLSFDERSGLLCVVERRSAVKLFSVR